MTILTLQIINMSKDLDDYAFEANKKINFNLKQLNKDIEVLPESITDLEGENISQLNYFKNLSEIIFRNSHLVGFKYPKIETNLGFAYEFKKKVYHPINEYFVSLTR